MTRLGLGSRNKKGLGFRISSVRFEDSELGPNRNRTETEYLEDVEENLKILKKNEFLGLGLRNQKWLDPNRKRSKTEYSEDLEFFLKILFFSSKNLKYSVSVKGIGIRL